MSAIDQLWRYPVKSMAGERVASITVDDRGLQGDRAWAVVDEETGLVASAKSPRRWGKLLEAAATTVDDSVRIELGAGSSVTTDEPDRAAAALSAWLGRGVELRPAGESGGGTIERDDPVAEGLIAGADLALQATARGDLGQGSPPGTFFDFAPIHLVSRATLDHLEHVVAEEDGSEGGGDLRRFRPNLVVGGDAAPFSENDWPGSVLRVGDVEIEILLVSPRCVVPSLPQLDLGRNVGTIRAVARRNRVEIDGHGIHSCAGAYGRVLRPGTLTEGAAIEFRRL